jgi:hypothetical protein
MSNAFLVIDGSSAESWLTVTQPEWDATAARTLSRLFALAPSAETNS